MEETWTANRRPRPRSRARPRCLGPAGQAAPLPRSSPGGLLPKWISAILLVQEALAVEVLGGVDDPPEEPPREGRPDADADERDELGEAGAVPSGRGTAWRTACPRRAQLPLLALLLLLAPSREAMSDATSSVRARQVGVAGEPDGEDREREDLLGALGDVEPSRRRRGDRARAGGDGQQRGPGQLGDDDGDPRQHPEPEQPRPARGGRGPGRGQQARRAAWSAAATEGRRPGAAWPGRGRRRAWPADGPRSRRRRGPGPGSGRRPPRGAASPRPPPRRRRRSGAARPGPCRRAAAPRARVAGRSGPARAPR